MTSKNLRDLASFDELIAQRADAIGADGRVVPIDGFGKTWHLNAPNLQSAEWNDRFNALTEDVRDDAISTADFREELGELMLSDQKEDFFKEADKAGIDPLMLLQFALDKMGEAMAENPTRPSSRSTQKRAKRR